MKERLQELLTHEHLTPVRFAELVEVQRSSVSHVLSGRNKPSLDFIGKILSAFPHVSPDWLILGTGEYKRTPSGRTLEAPVVNREVKPASPQQSFVNSPPPVREESRATYGQKALFEESLQAPSAPGQAVVSGVPDQEMPPAAAPAGKGASQVVKMGFFYADRTFEVYYPGR
jgi:transcriptional regulator with XRE-family HTH domain